MSKDQITALASAIMDMVELDKGLAKGKLEKLIETYYPVTGVATIQRELNTKQARRFVESLDERRHAEAMKASAKKWERLRHEYWGEKTA